MKKKLVIAYIGNGKSANRYHIPFVLTRDKKISIKTIFSPKDSPEIWERIPGVIYTHDIQDILLDSEIKVVVLSTPTPSHYTLAKQVLESGKNCVCEKPFTFTESEAIELFDFAAERGLMLQCYQNRRFDSDFLTAQKVIESGKIGKVMEVEITFDYYRPEIPLNHNRKYITYTGFFYGHGCHTLDQVISYWGIPKRVNYDVRQLLGEGRMNDYFDVDLFYDHTKVSIKSSYFRVKARPPFTVYGDKGMFVKYVKDKQEYHLKMMYLPKGHMDFGKDEPEEYGTIFYYDDSGVYHEEKVITERGDYGCFYDALYETIVNNQPQLVTPEQTIAQISILEKGISNLK